MVRPHAFLCRWSSWWWICSSDSHGGGETTLETAKRCPLGGVGTAKCLEQCLVFGDRLSGELVWSLPSSCGCSEMCQDCGPGLESYCTVPGCACNTPAVNHMALNVKELFSHSELICNLPLPTSKWLSVENGVTTTLQRLLKIMWALEESVWVADFKILPL